jgi:hypothetical protein
MVRDLSRFGVFYIEKGQLFRRFRLTPEAAFPI